MKPDFNTHPNEAPMTEPTEAEIEAAALAACNTRRELYGSPMIASLAALIPEARENELLFARAALTAAAQVRERVCMEALQRAAEHDRPAICRWCNKMHRGGPENCGNPDATYTKAQAQPSIMPIYSSTEDQD